MLRITFGPFARHHRVCTYVYLRHLECSLSQQTHTDIRSLAFSLRSADNQTRVLAASLSLTALTPQCGQIYGTVAAAKIARASWRRLHYLPDKNGIYIWSIVWEVWTGRSLFCHLSRLEIAFLVLERRVLFDTFRRRGEKFTPCKGWYKWRRGVCWLMCKLPWKWRTIKKFEKGCIKAMKISPNNLECKMAANMYVF